ncbi:MAG: DUF3800 domain-containing protein [Verrucomicrobia bacterium]|nr:DUF3800 domain-containing protein [Verrucomicrobiota bacterium]
MTGPVIRSDPHGRNAARPYLLVFIPKKPWGIGIRIVGLRVCRPLEHLISMLFVYVDESGSPSSSRTDPNYPIFVMAACVFEPEQYATCLLPAVGTLKLRHLGSDSPVLHESEIRKRLGIFNFKGDVQARTAFIEGLSSVVQDCVPRVVAAVVCHSDSECHASGPSHWVFERRGKREDAAVSKAFDSLMLSDATHEFVSKGRGLAGLEMADMLARPIGLSVLRPAQLNRALHGLRERMTVVVV